MLLDGLTLLDELVLGGGEAALDNRAEDGGGAHLGGGPRGVAESDHFFWFDVVRCGDRYVFVRCRRYVVVGSDIRWWWWLRGGRWSGEFSLIGDPGGTNWIEG